MNDLTRLIPDMDRTLADADEHFGGRVSGRAYAHGECGLRIDFDIIMNLHHRWRRDGCELAERMHATLGQLSPRTARHAESCAWRCNLETAAIERHHTYRQLMEER